ncbi:alpha/beta hydrolase [Streptomyces sp. NPDC005438]|uniref:alpha/beta hydrolase n=1 Tax=Streptomyces sp. NPDC005438 TaxID=3156880 RepID=UPI0033BDC61F
MPIGYLVTVVLAGCFALFALSPIRGHGPLGVLSYYFGLVFNEIPFVVIYWLMGAALIAEAQDDLRTPLGWTSFGLSVLVVLGYLVVAWRALPAREQVRRSLVEGLGADWRAELPADWASRLRERRPWARILLWPFPFRGRKVERLANIPYGPDGWRNTLDVYRRPGGETGRPVLVYLHGGRFVSGRKNREARPILHRLARQGWVCVSANYRLSPEAVFPDHLVDLKRVIAWARQHGHEYGADASTLFVAGSSAGGHLAAFAGLTPNEPVYQPDFESVDTSVTGVISLYGWYGNVNGGERVPSSPFDQLRPDAPPFFVTHGDLDPLVLVEGAREFVGELRRVSDNVVVYAELSGAHHSYDLFHSLRCEAVVDGVEAFVNWARAREAAR